ncbi:hypothetical protein COUCH_06315 [Couchioplanes caeruleus]|uniref:hypothetical protein n=1 Tax=Couchioplanes caeruleus TaxID=56438 RepID=UPI0020BE7171|nr:hypothetical protein [Couchioplanes caeruleus]UQU65920.1 hypothetical protein COUCH_06315 [Couchioplanes caeruleus]
MSGTGSALAEIIGGGPGRTSGPPATADMTAVLAAAQHRSGPPLKIRRHDSDEGPAFWRWDCGNCGEYGGGRHHSDAVSRAMRHCAEHPEHRSSLLPPARCRERDHRLAVHPMLFALDDDPGPPPLAV